MSHCRISRKVPPLSAEPQPTVPHVTVRYWAGAQAAAGIEQEQVAGTTLADVLGAITSAHPPLKPVVEVASILVDGLVSDRDRTLSEGQTVEVLPPFAGG